MGRVQDTGLQLQGQSLIQRSKVIPSLAPRSRSQLEVKGHTLYINYTPQRIFMKLGSNVHHRQMMSIVIDLVTKVRSHLDIKGHLLHISYTFQRIFMKLWSSIYHHQSVCTVKDPGPQLQCQHNRCQRSSAPYLLYHLKGFQDQMCTIISVVCGECRTKVTTPWNNYRDNIFSTSIFFTFIHASKYHFLPTQAP